MTAWAVVVLAITAAACGGPGGASAASRPTEVDLGGAAPPAPRPLAPLPDDEASPSASSGSIAWITDEHLARERARRDDRPLLVFVTAAWCLPCKALDDELFVDARIVGAARGAVALRVDVTDVDRPATLPLMARLGARGVPFVQVLGPEGRERFRAEALPVDADALERALTE